MKSKIGFSPLLTELVDALTLFPGVGAKSAQRMAFHILKEKHKQRGIELGSLIQKACDSIRNCSSCNNYTENEQCDLCLNPKRLQSVLCVVETPADVLALENAACFHGRYFVLMGALSPLDGIGPSELKLDKLLSLLKTESFEEVILATNATVEGEATADYIASLAAAMNIKTSRPAYGIPIGGELEYIDGNTLEKALKQRSTLSHNEI